MKKNEIEKEFALKLHKIIDEVKNLIDNVVDGELHGLKCEIWEAFKESHKDKLDPKQNKQ